jgi:hypothetical protein
MTDVERMRDALQEMVDAFDYIPLTGDFERRRAARAKAQTALHSPERSAARSDATEKFAKAMYLRGVHDGLKHGPIVTRWDIPPHLIRDWIKDTGIALSPPSRDGK